MLWECKEGCQLNQPKSKGHPGECEKHGRAFVYTKALKSNTQLVRVSARRQGQVRRQGSTLKQGRGFAASKAQREKVKGLPCIVCGRDGYEAKVDPAHVWSRSYTPCECPDGVVPLCRECHSVYDDPNQHLDLLPKLIERGYRAEFCHAFVVHEIPITDLLEEVTGVKWAPVSEESAYVPDEAVSVGG